MPLIIPEFVQYQGTLFPLRGLWNAAPIEGDRFVNLEVDWGSPGLLGVSCVQVQLSGNSPVAFSQIAALSVDNSRCGSDVDFVFPDSGFLLTVPAFNQGIYPIFSNALMFYINAPLAGFGDITIAQVLNSVPPPVAIQPTSEQEQQGSGEISLAANATSTVVSPPTSGTLNGFSLLLALPATGGVNLFLVDGTGKNLWSGTIQGTGQTLPINVSGLHVRFQDGLFLQVSGTTMTAGSVVANAYFSQP